LPIRDRDTLAVPQKDRSQWLKLLKLVVSAGILGWLACRMDWASFHQALGNLHSGLWFAAVGIYLVAQLVSGWRWQLLARPLGFPESLRQFTRLYFIGMYFNLLLPTAVGGDVVRAWCLDGKSGRRLAAFLSVLVDRLSGLVILLLIGCLGVALCPVSLPFWIESSVWGLTAGGIASLIVLPYLARWTARRPKLNRLGEGVHFYLQHPRLLIVTAAQSIVVQLANVMLVWLIGLALDLSVPPLYYAIFVPMVTLLTLLPISLNGMGIREGSTVLFLAPLGVSQGSALCLAILWFFVLTVVSLCGGVVYMFGYFPRPEVQTHYGPIGGDPHQGRAGQSQAAA
jgi:uncharacterized membrane protein YbhN (UPF0104 family)